jgi:hypothetical protein
LKTRLTAEVQLKEGKFVGQPTLNKQKFMGYRVEIQCPKVTDKILKTFEVGKIK